MTGTVPTLLAAALGASLAACATVPSAHTGGPLPPSTMQCDAAPASWAIGHEPTAEVVERVRVDSHSQTTRVLHPGDVITMEFSSGRVNLKVNERNAIIAITCG